MKKNNVVKNLNNMMCLDIYLSSLNKEEYDKIKHSIKPLRYKPHPLMCWDIVTMQQQERIEQLKKTVEYNELMFIAEKNQWDFNLNNLFDNDYEALILADAQQFILWVNDGFETMTGYPKDFAIGKKPGFLQGINTSKTAKEQIRSKLFSGMSFTTRIINYKKNRQEYDCEVTIFPIRNQKQEISAFLAMETEIQ